MTITIKVNNNGSLLISAADAASVQLVTADGTVIALPEGKNVALCRCGASARKPFCDGGHKASGFDGTCATAGPAVSPPAPSPATPPVAG
ncbi:MAG TPA: CDGSH iron-sulfur domain-containing protein [Gemmatimonadaceae bacterium]|nr:CDGSH iron-sulfur domain-containing protein [Gemmatimonadaceae bacterium]